MALDGASTESKIPAAPGAVPPPPAPPTMAKQAKALIQKVTPETEAALAQLKAQVKPLFERINNGDTTAKAELNALRAPFTEKWKQAKIDTNINGLKTALDEAKNELEERTTALNQSQTAFNRAMLLLQQEIEAAKQQLIQFASNPTMTTRIQHRLSNIYPTRLDELTNKMQQIVAEDGTTITSLQARLSSLQEQCQQAESLVYQCYILEAACIPPRTRAVAAPTVARPVINLREWYNKGLINGYFYTNLKDFIVTQADVDADRVETTYTDDYVLDQYNKYITDKLRGGFTHLTVLGIAAGYITRDYATHPYVNNPMRVLENSITDQSCKDILNERLAELYRLYPEFATPPVAGVNAAVTPVVEIDDAANSIDQFIAGRSKAVGGSNTNTTHAPSSSSSSSSSSSFPSPVVARPPIAQLEERAQKAFEAGNQNQATDGKPIGHRGPNLAQAQDDAQVVLNEYQALVGTANAFLRDAITKIAGLLEINENDNEEAILNTAVERVATLRNEKSRLQQQALDAQQAREQEVQQAREREERQARELQKALDAQQAREQEMQQAREREAQQARELQQAREAREREAQLAREREAQQARELQRAREAREREAQLAREREAQQARELQQAREREERQARELQRAREAREREAQLAREREAQLARERLQAQQASAQPQAAQNADTPIGILRREWSVDKVQAVQHAFECYKATHNQAPTIRQMGEWANSAGITGPQMNLYRNYIVKVR